MDTRGNFGDNREKESGKESRTSKESDKESRNRQNGQESEPKINR